MNEMDKEHEQCPVTCKVENGIMTECACVCVCVCVCVCNVVYYMIIMTNITCIWINKLEIVQFNLLTE